MYRRSLDIYVYIYYILYRAVKREERQEIL